MQIAIAEQIAKIKTCSIIDQLFNDCDACSLISDINSIIKTWHPRSALKAIHNPFTILCQKQLHLDEISR